MQNMQQIRELEQMARKLEPGPTGRKEISQKAMAYVDRFIESLPSRPGYSNNEVEKLNALCFDEHGKPFDELLDILEEEVDAVGINSASGAHLGYIPGGGIWTGAMADMLAAAANRYAGIAFSSPGAVAIENQIIQWACKLAGYPSTAHGNLSSGGSVSNQIAVQTARDSQGIHSGNVKNAVIYLTEQTHHSIYKAFRTTGLYEAVIRSIPVNNRYQMESAALKHQIEDDQRKGLHPFLVVATAGTTDTGAIDPLDSIADLCAANNLWFHVDAAYGGFFLLVEESREKLKGIDRSDSIVLDPHKTLFIPYGSGIVLVKNRKALLDSFSSSAAYMNDAYGQDEISPADSGPELSKHFRGLRLWLPLHLHGLEPFRATLKEKLLLCRYFHDEIAKMGFRTGPLPELSITIFRYPEDKENIATQRLVEALHEDGRYFFSTTVIDGELWIRCAVVSFRTHLREIGLALQMIQEVSQIK